MHLFGGYGFAHHRNGGDMCFALVVTASSKHEAIGFAWKQALAKCPKSEGWFDHSTDVVQIPQELVDQCSSFNQDS